jgi:hypothetical protein
LRELLFHGRPQYETTTEIKMWHTLSKDVGWYDEYH